jgi:hypothetical protein
LFMRVLYLWNATRQGVSGEKRQKNGAEGRIFPP